MHNIERKWIVSCCRSWCVCKHRLSRYLWCKCLRRLSSSPQLLTQPETLPPNLKPAKCLSWQIYQILCLPIFPAMRYIYKITTYIFIYIYIGSQRLYKNTLEGVRSPSPNCYNIFHCYVCYEFSPRDIWMLSLPNLWDAISVITHSVSHHHMFLPKWCPIPTGYSTLAQQCIQFYSNQLKVTPKLNSITHTFNSFENSLFKITT